MTVPGALQAITELTRSLPDLIVDRSDHPASP
jgi:hypothetical protein